MSVSTTAIFHPLARHVWALVSERLSARVDSASRRYIYIFIFIRLLAMFGPWAPNGYLLASIPPLGNIYIYFIRLLVMFGPWVPNGYLLRRFPLSAIYIYIYLSACSPWLGPGLRTTILRRIHYSALRPRPLLAIFLRPCGLACPLTAKSSIFFLTPPHGNIDFLFASRLM